MKKTLVIFGGGIVALVAIIAAVAVYVLANLGDLVKTAIEAEGPKITQSKVQVAKVDIDATSGSGAIHGLYLGNPQGFKNPSALELGQIKVTIDPNSLSNNPVVIKQVLIDKPVVTYEKGEKMTNFDALQKNVDDYLKSKGIGQSGQSETSAKEEEAKMIIEELIIRNGTINASLSAFFGKTLSTPLPDMTFKDIGKKQGGATSGEVVKQVLDKLTGSATGAVSKLDLNSLSKGATDAAASATKAAGEAAGSAQDAAKGATDEAGKAVEGAIGGVKKLFGD